MHTVVFLGILALLLPNAYAQSEQERCDALGPSDDGVPAAYYREECKGELALRRKDYGVAERHFRAALREIIFESPNYELKSELGWSLCQQRKRTEGLRELRAFMCMAEVELGQRQCTPEEKGLPKPSSKACAELCEGMSPLSEKGREALRERLKRARSYARRCAA